MGLISLLKGTLGELGAPELKIKPDIVEREKVFNKDDPTRRTWMLGHTYLCTGDLDQLKQDDNHSISRWEEKVVYYSDYKKYKRVRVRVKGTLAEAEEKLKEELFLRGCNAGVFYKAYTKNGEIIAEAVPAIVTCDL